MTDEERIVKLEKENEIMKKVLIYFVTRVNYDGKIKDFTKEDAAQLETWLGQLIL